MDAGVKNVPQMSCITVCLTIRMHAVVINLLPFVHPETHVAAVAAALLLCCLVHFLL